MVLGSANYSLGPAFQLRYRQGKLLLTGSAKPSCSWLFSCHCDCNLRQNTILHFLKPRRKDVKVGEKRQTYFGSKATKEIWGVLPIQHLLLMLLFPRFLRLYIYIQATGTNCLSSSRCSLGLAGQHDELQCPDPEAA